MASDERTPLLQPEPAKKTTAKPWSSWSAIWSPANRILFAGFLITLSFSYTQVPLLYMVRTMECDVFYSKNPPYEGDGDRCNRNEINAGTARQLSILGMTTTFCGTFNLFISGWQVKRWGPRAALVTQIFVPAIRVAAQVIGVLAGGAAGLIILQTTQLITIIGGPAGYILVVNTIAGEVVEPMQRTAVFGRLQGCIMLGQALGFFIGGLIGDTFGLISPFQTAFCSFLVATVYARLAMPYISPNSMSDGKNRAKGFKAFFAPLKVLSPQRIRLSSGRTKNHYGVFLLCCGVFLGVLATGYVPILVQQYAEAEFGFNQADNGRLIAGNAVVRAAFLTFIFPAIIGRGRKWFLGSAAASTKAASTTPEAPGIVAAPDADTRSGFDIPVDPGEFDAPNGIQPEDEPVVPDVLDEKAACGFDLYFLRWSLFVDGIVTMGSAFASRPWHMYPAALLLPFGSGTAPAAKGVITEMCPPSQRADALGAITLVENIARLSTLGLFGLVFSALSEIGQSYLTFYCNAALAMIAMAVLMLSHFPPANSKLVDDEAEGAPDDS